MSSGRILKPSRRSLLKAAGVAAAGALAAPYIGGVRRANAAKGSAKACIRFYLNGGARTTAMWDSAHVAKYNPYGQKAGIPGSVEHTVSDLWPDDFVDVLGDIAVVRTIWHGDGVGTNHAACQQRVLTGGTDDGLPGWATVANRELLSPLPAVMIGDANDFAEQLGSLGPTFSSIEIPNANSVNSIQEQFLAGLPTAMELRRISNLRNALSKRSIQRTPYRPIRNLPFQQEFTKEIIDQITNGEAFDITLSGDAAELGFRNSDGSPITNGELRNLFGVNDSGGGNQYGSAAMLATRLVQYGLTSVNIERGGWDTHGNEANSLPGRVADLGQAIRGLILTLKDTKLPFSESASALDDVLIVVDSEFNRDNTGAGGYNGGGGSDHQSTYARYFSAMFAGGGVAGGRAVGETDANLNPVDGITYHSSRINATIYDLLGISHTKYLGTDPIEELYA